MRPLIDEARHLDCLDAAWMVEGLAAGAGEESLQRSRHALTGLADNFGFPRFAELSRLAVPAESGVLSTELALIRDLIFRSTASFA